jgi:hypothetical protein
VDQDCDGTLAVDCSAATSFAPPGGVTWPHDDDICDPSTPYNLQGILVVAYDTSDLSGAYCLCNLSGSILIEQTSALTDLAGLGNVSRIDGLFVDNNYGITSLHGLERLETIGLMLRLKENYELVDLSGLNGLTEVRDSVELEFNYDLRSLHGLENLERIGGALTLTGNVPLVDFTGLGNLSSVGSYVYVDSNASLERFVGLEGIGHCCRGQPSHSPSTQPVWGELLEQPLKQTMRRSQERRTLFLC